MLDKINYHKLTLAIIDELNGRRPRLLAHVCCGPCATFPLDFLDKYFDVTILFNNSNIYPKKEYDRRYEELCKYVGIFNNQHNKKVEIILTPYENDQFNRYLKPFEDEPEGGKRCRICFALRMKEAFEYAQKHDFEFMTTVMTISRHKNAQIINEIGGKLKKKYQNVRYLYSDFKKNQGQDKANQLCKEYCLYRQLYCGCIYSYKKFLNNQTK
jgi:epoxyqueuosine reductase